MDFWLRCEIILNEHPIVIDRPAGSRHPRYPDFIYPLDYGYLAGTSAGDGQEIDVWRGSLPGNQLTGIVCTVDSLKTDSEVKLLIACTENEMDQIGDFYNTGKYMSAMLVKRGV